MNTKRLYKCYKELKCLVENMIDSDNQTLSYSDECELQISGGNSVPVLGHVNVYKEVVTPGVVEQIWGGDGNSAPHANPADIFNGAPGVPAGLPSHVNGAPDIDQVVVSWSNNTADDANNGEDQARWYGRLYIADDNTQIRDANSNSGERFRVRAGGCCSNPIVIIEDNVDTTGGTGNNSLNGGLPFVTLDKGRHFLAVEMTDRNAFGGIGIQTSTDGLTWTAFSGPTSIHKPTVECRQEKPCYELDEGESFCAPTCDTQGLAVIPGGEQLEIETEICEGPFVDETNRAGWHFGTWTAIITANSGNVERDWIALTTETSPNCITDMKYDVKFGDILTYLRRTRMYYWVDMRILINGVAVITKTYDSYEYRDERTGTAEDPQEPLQYEMTTLGGSTGIRLNVPAGATVVVELRDRYNVTAMQSEGYARIISGLRAQASMVYLPKTLVTNISY